MKNRVFSYPLLETSTISATRIRRTLTSVAGQNLSHLLLYGLLIDSIANKANGHLGRELFVFIRCGQSKASGRVNAFNSTPFLYSKKLEIVQDRSKLAEFCSCPPT